MRPHQNIEYYCGNVTDDLEHGAHYINKDRRCSKCEELKTQTTIMGRCAESAVCGPCQGCKVCEAEDKRNRALANPTADEIQKAIPYSTDILQDFLKT